MTRKLETNFIMTNGSQSSVEITQQGRRTMAFMSQMLQPFLLGYWVSFVHILEMVGKVFNQVNTFKIDHVNGWCFINIFRIISCRRV